MIIAIKAKQPNIIQKKFNCQYFLGKSLLFFMIFFSNIFHFNLYPKSSKPTKNNKNIYIIAKKSQPSVIR